MVQVDIPFSFGVGAFMATAVETGLRSERRSYFYLRGLTANLVLQTLFVFWLPLYLLASNFGFQTSHMWWHGDAITEYPAILPIFVFIYFAASIAGYDVGVRLVTSGKTAAARGIFVAACAFFIGWMAMQPGRTLVLGTYRDWVEGRAVWIWKDPAFTGLLGFAFVLFVVALRMFYSAIQREASAVAPAVARR